MSEFQQSKALVLDYHQALDSAKNHDIAAVLDSHVTQDYLWRGMHPFYEQQGASSVAEVFWKPFRESFSRVQRRPDVFMAGLNDADGFQSEWVCSMGHLLGLFDKDWLGIPSSGKMAFLRYCEFNRVQNGKIAETALFVDILGIMQQVGLNPLPLQTGAALITPGPMTHDGLLFDAQPAHEGDKTLALVNRMADELTSSDMHSETGELSNTWHDDMLWFGPAGIGAAYTQERYERQHQGPFSDGLQDIVFNGHVSRIAEGNYAGWFGWANLDMKASGGFLGMPASDRETEMRVVDIYRRDGEKLAENWIFIDILHYLHKQNLDVLGRMKQILRT
ncbi:MAG: ester cyclase [Halioglobus sp.]